MRIRNKVPLAILITSLYMNTGAIYAIFKHSIFDQKTKQQLTRILMWNQHNADSINLPRVSLLDYNNIGDRPYVASQRPSCLAGREAAKRRCQLNRSCLKWWCLWWNDLCFRWMNTIIEEVFKRNSAIHDYAYSLFLSKFNLVGIR